jgi:ribosomal protein S18 acetylase RimI-like enzyme
MMAETLKRWMMRNQLTDHPVAETWDARPITLADGALLGTLMYDAYHGTIDDEGETPDEARGEIDEVLAGKHGPLLSPSSLVIEEGKTGRALAATVITDWTDDRSDHRQPLLAFLMVHPAAQGKGMGIYLLSKSINALLQEGERELVLFVTVGNSAAQHIYQKLGFIVEDEFETNRIKPES